MASKKGFFSQSELAAVKSPTPLIARCGACKLHKACQTPKMPVWGNGACRIMIVAEQPSDDDDHDGRPLSGEGGRWVRDTLDELGVSLKRDCWVTHAAICAGNNLEAVGHCRPNLLHAIEQHKPEVIVLMGDMAITSLISHTWGRKPFGSPSRWVGYTIPDIKLNTWIIPTYSPSALIQPSDKQDAKVTLANLYAKQHLKQAVKLKGRPFVTPPDYASQVKIILDEEEAADWLSLIVKRGGPISFDYECNCLRPETRGSRLVTAAVCWQGKKTIAFPITDITAGPLSWLLRRHKVRKIGANIKFEERWTLNKFQHRVPKWAWDTMLAAHFIDNRRGVTGLKFQAYARLGLACYDEHISSYLEAGTNQLNQIDKLSLTDVLLYNGLDALATYRVAILQKEIICDLLRER